MNETARTIDNLLFYLQSEEGNYSRLAMDLLQRPGALQWSAEPHEMAGQRTRVRQCLPAKHHAPLDLNLLAFLLCRPNGATSRDAATEAMAGLSELPPLFPPALLKRFTHWSWQAVAVPVVAAASAASPAAAPPPVWFLVAATDEQIRLSPAPEWVGRLLGRTSLDALADGLDAARSLAPAGRNNFYLFPLTDPHGDLRIEGRSLGLPLALGALTAATGRGAEGSWLATGDLRADGTVHEVAADTLAAKANLAAAHKFRLFLYPQANLLKAGSEHCHFHGTAHLEEAWLWAEKFAPGCSQALLTCQTALSSAAAFVDNCASLTAGNLADCLQRDAFRRFRNELLGNPGLFNSLTKKLESLLEGATCDLKKAQELARIVQSGEDLALAGGHAPLSAFVWCSCNMALANHRGDHVAAENWRGAAEPYRMRAREADAARYSRFVNRFFIDALHNRYVFCPQLPKEFAEILHEEERYCRGGINYALGSLYGTAAQNYGFCGPNYFPELQACIAKAARAFGEGRHPESLGDYRRGFSYLFAAHMDRHEPEKARAALWHYLGVDSWERFQLALRSVLAREAGFAEYMLARYLARTHDPKNPEPGTDDLVHRLLNRPFQELGAGHPRQLYAYNVGRLAACRGFLELADRYWRGSLFLCDPEQSSDAGDTMRPMALLSLSALDEHGLLQAGDRQLTRRVLQHLRGFESLAKHFSVLLAGSEQHSLKLVRRFRPQLFPFSYR